MHVYGTMPSLGNLPHHTMAVCRTPGAAIPKLGVIITLVPPRRRKIGQLPRPADDPIGTRREMYRHSSLSGPALLLRELDANYYNPSSSSTLAPS